MISFTQGYSSELFGGAFKMQIPGYTLEGVSLRVWSGAQESGFKALYQGGFKIFLGCRHLDFWDYNLHTVKQNKMTNIPLCYYN